MKKTYLFIAIVSMAIFSMAIFSTSASADLYSGNGNSGFGGQVGLGSLEITDNCVDTITFCMQLDQALGNGNTAIIYIDSGTGGGFADTSTFVDTGDQIRRGISNFDVNNARTTIGFNGFNPNFAIGADNGFQDLWQLTGGGPHIYLGGTDKLGSDYAQGTYKIAISMAALGVNPGDTIQFGVTHTSQSGFLSNELIAGGSTGFDAGNPGWGQNVSIDPFSYTITTAVPEPGSLSILAVVGIAGVLRRRK